MTNTPGRRRAPAMSPEQRREMIVRAALPLVVEYGTSVTTAQIARAAGIGEGTIFRAFGDKDAVLAACMAEAARPDDTLAYVASISLDLPLEERLVEASEALHAHLARMGAVAGALAASGGLRRDPRLLRPSEGAGSSTEAQEAPGEAVGRGEPAGQGQPGANGELGGSGEAGGQSEAGGHGEKDGARKEGALREAMGRGASGGPGRLVSGREASLAATREVLTGLFEPDRDRLRLPPERLAEAFQFLLLAAGRRETLLTSAELVSLFLHGAVEGDEAG
ncbi:TetR/AcrR family transcriptional regulator [Nonomuraea phyllanthi]|uniref:TetR/AcrR family transcriptional regulator n=1 Tax=Nonomuraea phyllanthi TaxID=2219224 RepID=UPI001D132F79|nr:TetR/AcrR family transcriptional regulator [Nonomuraea phyllanthi]